MRIEIGRLVIPLLARSAGDTMIVASTSSQKF